MSHANCIVSSIGAYEMNLVRLLLFLAPSVCLCRLTNPRPYFYTHQLAERAEILGLRYVDLQNQLLEASLLMPPPMNLFQPQPQIIARNTPPRQIPLSDYTIQQLVLTYFTFSANTLPYVFLHPKLFFKRLKRGMVQTHVLYAIIAFGALYLRSSEVAALKPGCVSVVQRVRLQRVC